MAPKVVLVVEDSIAMQRLLREWLDVAGYDVRMAASVAEAHALHEGCDVMLVDLGLPNGDGLDVVQTYITTPHVTITGNPTRRAHLYKPVTSDEILGALATVLEPVNGA